MDTQEILSHVDHTLLKPTAIWQQIECLCREAIEHKTASVCIPPCYIRRVKKAFGSEVAICTVIGFPLGYSTTTAKVAEAREAVKDGADEIDMVINISDAKNNDFDAIEKEIGAIREATQGKILKVIIETCYLTEEEKITLCGCVTRAGADFIKTSTGFGTGGATLSDIQLFSRNIGSGVRMKAAGGVKTREDLEMFLEAGCDRIGTSSAVRLLKK